MAIETSSYPVRECAQELLRIVAEMGDRIHAATGAMEQPVLKLLQQPDLLTVGVRREGNHVGYSAYLYYDGDFEINLSHLPNGSSIPVHDHGMWEIIAVYRGALRHTVYDLVDEHATAPGSVDLRVVEERELGPFDMTVVAPPTDIHGFTALDDDTYFLAVLGGHLKPQRRYYQPSQRSLLIRGEKVWRTGR